MNSIIDFALKNRALVVLLSIAMLVSGYFVYRHLPVDAYPDISPVLVQVYVETDGLAPEEVEKYITFPIENVMNGLPNVELIRSVSNFGLSVVNIYFSEGTDIYFARQLVSERLSVARQQIPDSLGEPVMGPIATGLGQILFYTIEDPQGRYSLSELRDVQDWLVKLNLQAVPGVAEVLSIGGYVRQYQVQVDPMALRRFDITLDEVIAHIQSNNENVGAQFIVVNDEEYIVRSIGLASNLKDLRNIMVKSVDGTPVYLHQTAEVVVGGEVRRGLALGDGGKEKVVGMVLKLVGVNTSEVIDDVQEELLRINKHLPDGLTIQPYYDQAALVKAAIMTVSKALLLGVILVVLVLIPFMRGVGTTLVVALSIPFSVAFAFLLMKLFDVSANLMSLGGLAIAIGMMVDGAVVVVEKIDQSLKYNPSDTSIFEIVREACRDVIRPIIFAILIIIVVFVPIFTLEGVEGTTFRPLAYTVASAMLGSLLFAVLLAPVLSSMVLGITKRNKEYRPNVIVTGYKLSLARLLTKRYSVLLCALAMLAAGGAVLPRLGSEFVPRFNEGDLLIRATMAPSVSLEKSKDIISIFEKQLLDRFVEVETVVSRIGRGEVGAHADPVNNAEIFVKLKPQSAWVNATSLDGLYRTMSEYFESFPAAKFSFTQPIAASIDELVTGTKAELAVKIYGDDLKVLASKSNELEDLLKQVEGAEDVQRDQLSGAPQLQIVVNRLAVARYGLDVHEVQQYITQAVGGISVGKMFDGVKRFDIQMRLGEQHRNTADSIRLLLIENSKGQLIPLSELASINEVVGPRQISRENNQRFTTVQTNVRGRDIGSFVDEADALIQQELELPAGYSIRWGGQYELQQKANQRLLIVIPVTLMLVFFLLYLNLQSLRAVFVMGLIIPLALTGGLIVLWLSGQNMSVPASVGFIALFGIALENGLVLVGQIRANLEAGMELTKSCVEGAVSRLRAVIMTAATSSLGLLPLLFATGTGSEVQKPLATVVVGGLVSATIVTLFVLPVLYGWMIKAEISNKSRYAGT